MAKRKTWKDRVCHHGRKAETRIVVDMIHCDLPECWPQVQEASLPGFKQMKQRAEQAEARLAKVVEALEAGLEATRSWSSVEVHAARNALRAALAAAQQKEEKFPRGEVSAGGRPLRDPWSPSEAAILHSQWQGRGEVMSKEIWLLAYERNLADGMSEAEAVKHADERAADIQASRLDAAVSATKEVTPSKSKDNL